MRDTICRLVMGFRVEMISDTLFYRRVRMVMSIGVSPIAACKCQGEDRKQHQNV